MMVGELEEVVGWMVVQRMDFWWGARAGGRRCLIIE